MDVRRESVQFADTTPHSSLHSSKTSNDARSFRCARPETIKGFEEFFCHKQYRNIDGWLGFNHFSSSVMNYGMWMTQLLALVICIAAVILVAVWREEYDDVALIGVALNYSFLLPYFLAFFSQASPPDCTAAGTVQSDASSLTAVRCKATLRWA